MDWLLSKLNRMTGQWCEQMAGPNMKYHFLWVPGQRLLNNSTMPGVPHTESTMAEFHWKLHKATLSQIVVGWSQGYLHHWNRRRKLAQRRKFLGKKGTAFLDGANCLHPTERQKHNWDSLGNFCWVFWSPWGRMCVNLGPALLSYQCHLVCQIVWWRH